MRKPLAPKAEAKKAGSANNDADEKLSGLKKFLANVFVIFFASRHQSSAMYIIMLGGEDTHPWSATKVGNSIPAKIWYLD